ncbi:MAG: hypothetical protein HQL55_15450, partial [Magnetococcales bacterium]|nr:hypothetical protein [Magnetococcales bacterium]
MNTMKQNKRAWFSIRHKFALLFVVLQLLGLLAVGYVAITTVDELAEEGAQLSMRYAVRRMIRDATVFHVEVQRDIRTALENNVFRDYFSLPESRQSVEVHAPGRITFSLPQLQAKNRVDQWLLALQKWYPL